MAWRGGHRLETEVLVPGPFFGGFAYFYHCGWSRDVAWQLVRQKHLICLVEAMSTHKSCLWHCRTASWMSSTRLISAAAPRLSPSQQSNHSKDSGYENANKVDDGLLKWQLGIGGTYWQFSFAFFGHRWCHQGFGVFCVFWGFWGFWDSGAN